MNGYAAKQPRFSSGTGSLITTSSSCSSLSGFSLGERRSNMLPLRAGIGRNYVPSFTIGPPRHASVVRSSSESSSTMSAVVLGSPPALLEDILMDISVGGSLPASRMEGRLDGRQEAGSGRPRFGQMPKGGSSSSPHAAIPENGVQGRQIMQPTSGRPRFGGTGSTAPQRVASFANSTARSMDAIPPAAAMSAHKFTSNTDRPMSTDKWSHDLSDPTGVSELRALGGSLSYPVNDKVEFRESRFKEEPHQAGSGRPRFGQSGSFTAKANVPYLKPPPPAIEVRSADVRLSAKGSSLTSQRNLDTIVPTQNSTKINTVMASSPPLSPQSASSRLEEKEGTVVKEHPAAEFNRRVKEMTNSLNYVSVASGSSSEGTSAASSPTVSGGSQVVPVNLRNERSAQSSYFERMFRQHLQSASVRTNEVQQPATPASQPQAGVPVDNTSKPPSLTNGYYFPPPVAKIVDDSPRESGVMATSHRFSQPAITIQGNVLASENSNKPGYVTPGAYFSRSSTIGAMANGVHSPEPRTMNRDEFKQTVIAEEKSKKNMVVATEAQCFPPAVISGQEQKEKLAEKSSDRPVHLASVSQCNGIHPVDQVTNARTVKPAAHLPTAEINQYPSIHDMEFGSTFRNGTSISVCVLDVMDPQGLYVTDKDFDQYKENVLHMAVELEISLNQIKPLSQMPPLYTVVCAKDPNDDEWCGWFRAAIYGIESPTSAMVLWLDFGKVTTVRLTDMKPIPVACLSKGKMAIPVSLTGIRPVCGSVVSSPNDPENECFPDPAITAARELLMDRKGTVFIQKVLPREGLKGSFYLESGPPGEEDYQSIADVYAAQGIAQKV